MASASTTTNSELAQQSSSICSLDLHSFHRRHSHDSDSSSMDDLLKDIYSSNSAGVDEVWSRIVAGDADRCPEASAAMTLEDFLTKNGPPRDEDAGALGFGGFQSGSGAPVSYVGAPAVGRGKRRAVEEPVVDKATQQKQRRMIKNRESAARSRERKQAYTIELEVLVNNLEEENARLLREEADRMQERYKQLMANLIPVVESKEKKITERFYPKAQIKEEKMSPSLVPLTAKNCTRVVLRRVSSMEW